MIKISYKKETKFWKHHSHFQPLLGRCAVIKMRGGLILLLFCGTAAYASEGFEDASTRVALKVYEDCSASEDFYVCLKKKAVTFLDRLGRAEKFSISDSVKIVRVADAPVQKDEVTEAKLDEILPRSADAKNAALTEMLSEKISDFLKSRTVEISLPRAFAEDDDLTEEGKLPEKYVFSNISLDCI